MMTITVSRNTIFGRGALALCGALALSACTMAPMGPLTRPAPSVPSPVTPVPAPADQVASLPAPGVPGAAMGASAAEQACIAAGRERGLDVAGVVGSRAVAEGTAQAGRDVMLQVRRSGAQIEVRCNYVNDTRMARIMLI